MSYIEDRPAGFETAHVSQEFIEVVVDSELANRIEKTRKDVLNALGKKRTRTEIRDELPRPDPANIECVVCTLSSGRRSVMTRVETNSLESSENDEWTDIDRHETFYHCSNCNLRIYRDDPDFMELAETSPHDALTVVAINDLTDESNKPIMVAKTSDYKKHTKKQERQLSLDRIMDQLDDRP